MFGFHHLVGNIFRLLSSYLFVHIFCVSMLMLMLLFDIIFLRICFVYAFVDWKIHNVFITFLLVLEKFPLPVFYFRLNYEFFYIHACVWVKHTQICHTLGMGWYKMKKEKKNVIKTKCNKGNNKRMLSKKLMFWINNLKLGNQKKQTLCIFRQKQFCCVCVREREMEKINNFTQRFHKDLCRLTNDVRDSSMVLLTLFWKETEGKSRTFWTK